MGFQVKALPLTHRVSDVIGANSGNLIQMGLEVFCKEYVVCLTAA
jgi:hypothetical protein